MSAEAFSLFVAGCVLLAALLVLASARANRSEQRELESARLREAQASDDIVAARRLRSRLAAHEAVANEDQREAARSDPRGIGDGLGGTRRVPGRFRRVEKDVPAPFAGDTPG
jgi:hypothetical protein